MVTASVAANKAAQLEDVYWVVAEGLSSMNDVASNVITVVEFLRDAYGYDEEPDGGKFVKNPAFLANKIGGKTTATRKYFAHRAKVSLGGSAVSLAGGLSSSVTFVDVGAVTKETSALVSTSAHMVGVKAAGAKFKKSQTVTSWIDAIMKAKACKLGLRAANLAGATIPLPAVGLTLSAATAVAKLGIKVTMQKLIARTAMEIHWRAYQEIAIARRGSGPVGPASSIFYEIFTRRGVTRIFGKHDTEALIRDPAGWMALNDKLMLL